MIKQVLVVVLSIMLQEYIMIKIEKLVSLTTVTSIDKA
jgi:hypothetical protein